MDDRLVDDSYHVMAIDDERPFLDGMRRVLRGRGFTIEPYTNPHEALAQLERDPYGYDLIILDVNIQGTMDGVELIDKIKHRAHGLPVVMLTGDPSAATATAAFKAGAFDYLLKPLPSDHDEYLHQLHHAGREGRTRRELHALGDTCLIGNSQAMQELRRQIKRAAANEVVSVLITGASGTGKELVAREIHQLSARRERPWVAINCGAIPENLMDSELFGTRKGAFTDAVNKIGYFEQAHTGTLFLDEIAELPMQSQPRFLRVLQEREFRPLGAQGKPQQVDVRIISATNKDLEREIAERNFREDLYYRIKVLEIAVPPLRDRLDDVSLLARHFAGGLADRDGRGEFRFTEAALAALTAFDWPGNIRELQNAVENACTMASPGRSIDVEHLPPQIRERPVTVGPSASAPAQPAEPSPAAPAPTPVDDVTWAFEIPLTEAIDRVKNEFTVNYLVALLTQTAGNVSEASRIAQRDRANFRRLLRAHDVDPETFRR